MGCECCYAVFAVLLFIVLYHGPKWFSMDGFENYTKIYKSEDGYYLAIKEGPSKNPAGGAVMFLHNDWVKFKGMTDLYDKFMEQKPEYLTQFYRLMDQNNALALDMEDYSGFYFMTIWNHRIPTTWMGIEDISWAPLPGSGSFYGLMFLNMRIKNNGTLIETRFDYSGEETIGKTFTLYTA
jgi:hypothetical protein